VQMHGSVVRPKQFLLMHSPDPEHHARSFIFQSMARQIQVYRFPTRQMLIRQRVVKLPGTILHRRAGFSQRHFGRLRWRPNLAASRDRGGEVRCAFRGRRSRIIFSLDHFFYLRFPNLLSFLFALLLLFLSLFHLRDFGCRNISSVLNRRHHLGFTHPLKVSQA
jgi:hypothetical protein